MTRFADLPRQTIETSAGALQYRRAGTGPTLFFVHGVLVSGDLWGDVVDQLSDRFDCVVPELPLGSHLTPARTDADLTPFGLARLLAELIERLSLSQPTVIANDTGGAVSQLLVVHHSEQVGKLILTPCDSFDQFPPVEFKFLKLLPHVPGLTWMLSHLIRSPGFFNLTLRAGRAVKHAVAPDILKRFAGAAADNRLIRRDIIKCLSGIDTKITNEVAAHFPSVHQPVLLAWGDGGMFSRKNAERMASLFPAAELKLIEDCWAFASLDQPGPLAQLIADFSVQAR